MDELVNKNLHDYFREFETAIGTEFTIAPYSGHDYQFIEDHLEGFEIFRHFDKTLWHLIRIVTEAGPFYLFVLKVNLGYHQTGRIGGHEYEVFGFLNLKRNYAHTLVRPETVKDKILDYFVHAEIDIPSHSQFSDSFYVLSNEPEAAKDFLTHEIMDLFCSAGDLWVEVKDNILVIGYRENISMEIGLKVAALTKEFKRIL
jgi:hypothetical protein